MPIERMMTDIGKHGRTLKMKRGSKVLTEEDGVVLVVAMSLILTLSLIGIAANNNVITDTAIASNYLASQRSFYLAEAGLEHGKLECVQRYIGGSWSDFNPIIRGADGTFGTADDGILNIGSSVGFHGGTYEVRVTNDVGDSGGAGTDNNSTITIASTGTHGGSTTVVKATIKMNTVPNIPGSISLIGEADTNFSGNSFFIDGNDYNLAGTAKTGGTALNGINVGDVSSWSHQGNNTTAVNDASSSLASNQKDNVQGAGYIAPGSHTDATPSVNVSNTLDKVNLTDFVNVMKEIADNKISYPPDISGRTDGADNCLSGWPSANRTTCLGSTTNPKITHIDKTDPRIDNTGFQTKGNITGAGILIIEGNDLQLKGGISWTGLVIVLGDYVGFGADGGGNQQNIIGGLVVAEYLTDSSYMELLLNGNLTIKASKAAIDMVQNLINGKKKYTVVSWQRVY